MATDDPTFDQWLRDAKIGQERLSADQVALLEASFRFVQCCGEDYYSRRVLCHFLLHCQSGLKVAQIARLLGVSRSTASEQQHVSSKEMVQAAHHRMAGRPHGKLLSRYAGPIAQFLITHPKASRLDILDFIERTWEVRASTVALYHFMNWKALPAEEFVAYEEDGACVAAPPKEIRLADTRTTLKGESDEEAVRTIVCREVVPGPKKDRWHPLYTTSEAEPWEVLETFRTRQHHEQGYRVGVHDEFLNAVPCGYDKESPNRKRPRFHRGPLQMIGWLTGLVYNAVADLTDKLPDRYHGAHVATARRTFFNKRGQLYLTPNTLIVQLSPFATQETLIPLIDSINHQSHRLPWLDNRRLVLSLTPTSEPRDGP